MGFLLVVALLIATNITAGAAAHPVVVADFEDPSQWSPHPADGVTLALIGGQGTQGRALGLDFSFGGGGGYAVARRAVSLKLPDNYAFTFWVRGPAPSNHLEFKLIDASGENVWWSVKRDFHFPSEWERITIKKRHIQFAWGPLGGGEILEVAAIELVVTAGSGGAGTVWIDELELVELPPPDSVPAEPRVTASSAIRDHPARLAFDRDSTTAWRPVVSDTAAWIALDFGGPREYGGLVLDWAGETPVSNYTVEASDDGRKWRALHTVRGGNGGRDYIYLPEAESSRLRVRIAGARNSTALTALAVQPLAWSATRETFFQAIARDARRGIYPRGMSGEQTYWTVVGIDHDQRESIFGEDGAIETGEDRVGIEPFLRVGEELVTWSDVTATQSLPARPHLGVDHRDRAAVPQQATRSHLDSGSLPIPSVTWRAPAIELEVTAFAIGEPGASSVVARYRLQNLGQATLSPILYLAIRPFQVYPPSQTLNRAGGTAPISALSLEDRTVVINGHPAAFCLTRPAKFGAVAFDAGDVVRDYLARGELPPARVVTDSFQAASGAMAYSFELGPAGETEVSLVLPLYPESPPPPAQASEDAKRWAEGELSRCRGAWEERLERVTIRVAASSVVESLKSQLAYILVNRAGPAIQPGSRSYARSWIRDGALTGAALLRLGHAEAVREFIEWFAPHQYPNGKIPCVVDWRGADPVPEHDSSGEFIYLVAEYYRYTRDREFAAAMWPRVARAAAYLDSLRHERMTEEFRAPDKRHFYGILPPSISHEGYSAKPMHSYWDDFFALRGFADAAFLAKELGRSEAKNWDQVRDEFARDLAASVEAARRVHGIDYVPGSADLGDFDATSTTIAFDPTVAAAILDSVALRNTFERYDTFVRERRSGTPWEAFTPYEMRAIGTYIRLGWRERAQELLRDFLGYQRPSGWRQWPEVVRSAERAPHFLGDLPHTWVGSDYIRSVLDAFAYERESDQTLVLGAGIPLDWLATNPGVYVENLRTPYGPLSYVMNQTEDGTVVVNIARGLRVPPGGIAVSAPLIAIRSATLGDGRVTPNAAGEVIVRNLPAKLVLKH
jgi:F5/8 type C domain